MYACTLKDHVGHENDVVKQIAYKHLKKLTAPIVSKVGNIIVKFKVKKWIRISMSIMMSWLKSHDAERN